MMQGKEQDLSLILEKDHGIGEEQGLLLQKKQNLSLM